MQLNFEETLAKLEEIVEKLESADVLLDDALALFEEGMRLSQICTQKLEQAELRVQQLITPGDELPATEPFETLPAE